jgi:hypothetical protein
MEEISIFMNYFVFSTGEKFQEAFPIELILIMVL